MTEYRVSEEELDGLIHNYGLYGDGKSLIKDFLKSKKPIEPSKDNIVKKIKEKIEFNKVFHYGISKDSYIKVKDVFEIIGEFIKPLSPQPEPSKSQIDIIIEETKKWFGYKDYEHISEATKKEHRLFAHAVLSRLNIEPSKPIECEDTYCLFNENGFCGGKEPIKLNIEYATEDKIREILHRNATVPVIIKSEKGISLQIGNELNYDNATKELSQLAQSEPFIGGRVPDDKPIRTADEMLVDEIHDAQSTEKAYPRCDKHDHVMWYKKKGWYCSICKQDSKPEKKTLTKEIIEWIDSFTPEEWRKKLEEEKRLFEKGKPDKSMDTTKVLADLKEFFNETGLIFDTSEGQLEDLADTICKEDEDA